MPLSVEHILLIFMFTLFFLDSVKVEGFIRALSHFNNRKKLYILCWHQIVFSLFLLFLSSGRLMTDLSWRWTGIPSMTSYSQVEKIVNIRWAVFEYTFRRLWGVLNPFLPLKPCPTSSGMGQFWPSALLLDVSWLSNHLFVLGTRWRGVFCGLLQHPAALWQDWSKKTPLTLHQYLIFELSHHVSPNRIILVIPELFYHYNGMSALSSCRKSNLFWKWEDTSVKKRKEKTSQEEKLKYAGAAE